MKVVFCQYSIEHGEISKNLQEFQNTVKAIKSDLIVLPELSFTGYYFKKKEDLLEVLKQGSLSSIIDVVQNVARRTSSTILFGHPEVDNEKLYNSVFVVNETGLLGKRRKLNNTDNESIFDQGDSLDVIRTNNLNLGVMICYESWFPEAARNLADKGAELFIIMANFGGPYTPLVARVRALENSMPLILVNRIGQELIQDTMEHFCGRSAIIDGYGNTIIEAGDSPCLVSYELDVKTYSRHENLISKTVLKDRKKYDKL